MNNQDELYNPSKMDVYDYTLEAGRFRRFLWFCAGADPQILEKCPHSDRVKEEGIGGIVLSTGILAFISSSYAFYSVFGPKVGYALEDGNIQNPALWIVVSILCGLIWALVIFNIDRFIVTSTGHGDGTDKITWHEFIAGIPRLLMAVVIGLTMAAPLEIRVFKSEIDAELHALQEAETARNTAVAKERLETDQARIDELISENKKKIESMQSENETAMAELRKRKDELAREINTGYGDRAKKREALLIKDETAFAASQQSSSRMKASITQEVESLEKKRAQVQADYDKKYQDEYRKAASLDGLGKRIQLAHELFLLPSIFLSLLLIIIEITPVLIKMMLIRGPYDYLSDNQSRIAIAKSAIELSEYSQHDGAGSTVNTRVQEIFHQADTIVANERNKLQAESELADVAYEIFKKKTSTDIENNPDHYLKEMGSGKKDEG